MFSHAPRWPRNLPSSNSLSCAASTSTSLSPSSPAKLCLLPSLSITVTCTLAKGSSGVKSHQGSRQCKACIAGCTPDATPPSTVNRLHAQLVKYSGLRAHQPNVQRVSQERAQRHGSAVRSNVTTGATRGFADLGFQGCRCCSQGGLMVVPGSLKAAAQALASSLGSQASRWGEVCCSHRAVVLAMHCK